VTLASTSRTTTGAPRWLVMALFASLAANLVVIGAAAGFVWRHHAILQAAGAQMLSPSLLSYASTLPPERHKELSARTEEQRQIVRPLRRQLREMREEAVNALAAESFDRERYQAVQARLLEADQKARVAVHQLYAEIAANMTPEERRGFAQWRQNRRKMRNLLDEPEQQAEGSQR
jgi:uncharacterized membrane protein